MKVIIIDNYDSFTYILKQYFGQLGANPVVFKNDAITLKELHEAQPTHLVISPGPGTVENPQDIGISIQAIESFAGEIPILGVCLGHQAIGMWLGAKIVHASTVMHGKRTNIQHEGRELFKGVAMPFEAMRYHSLAIADVRPPLKITAQAPDGTVMAIQHESLPIFGVQFHPESLGTPDGMKILKNFLNQ